MLGLAASAELRLPWTGEDARRSILLGLDFFLRR
jgi:hypothetical protein